MTRAAKTAFTILIPLLALLALVRNNTAAPAGPNPAPSPTYLLNFGSANLGGAPLAQTATIVFANSETLATAPYVVLTKGAQNLDFQAAATQPSANACVGGQGYSPGSYCQVNITFSPITPGLRIGALQLLGSSGAVLATVQLSGIGLGPQLTFSSSTASTTIAKGFGQPASMAIDGHGNVFLADTNNSAVEEIVAVNGVVSSTSQVVKYTTGFSQPDGVAVDGSGNLFVSDRGFGVVYELVAVKGTVSSNSQLVGLGSPASTPTGLAVDGSGNLYVADGSLNVVNELVAVNGAISSTNSPVVTVATGFSGPKGLAFDSSGNLFVADTGNNAVKKIVAVNGVLSATSNVVTVANNFANPYGVDVDSNDNVFVADFNNGALKEIVGVNGDVSPTSTVRKVATLSVKPGDVKLDVKGNLLYLDFDSGALVEIDRSDAPTPQFANTNVDAISTDSPQSVTVQNSGNAALGIGANFLQVAGSGTPPNCVAATTLAPGTTCNLSISFQPTTGDPLTNTATLTKNAHISPQSISLSGTGTPIASLVSVSPNSAPSGSQNLIFTLVGQNTHFVQGTNTFSIPYESITVNSITVTDATHATVNINIPLTDSPGPPLAVTVTTGSEVVTADSAFSITAPVSNNVSFASASIGAPSVTQTAIFNFPTATTLASTPYVVLTKGALNLDFQAAATQPSSNACVGGKSYAAGGYCAVNVTFSPTKPYQRIGAVQLMGSSGTPIATVNLTGIGVGPQVSFPSNSAVTTLATNGGFSGSGGIAVDGSGNVFVADTNNGAVKEVVAVNGVVTASSQVITVITGFSHPEGVAIDGSGNVLVIDQNIADENNGGLYEIVAANGEVSSNSSVVAIYSSFNAPSGIALDGSGNVFVAVGNDGAVYEVAAVNGTVTPNSTVTTVGGGLSYPIGIALDGNGNLFVADCGANAVEEIAAVGGAVSSSSAIVTIASGFSCPNGLAVDGTGNVFFSDQNNNATKEIVAVNGIVSSSSPVVALGSGFSAPTGVAVDGSENVFVMDAGNNLLKDINFSVPNPLSFATTNTGAQSAAQSVTVQNIGNATLTQTSFVESTNFAQVAGSGTPADCPALTGTLAAGASCNISLVFAPTTGGLLTGTSTLTDNNLNASGATQTINLSGTGLLLEGVTISVPAGVSFTLNGTGYKGTQTVSLAPGSYPLSTATPQSLGAGTQAVFSSWSDGGGLSHSITVGSSPLSITGSFAIQYQLTTTAGTGGNVSPTTGTYYNSGTAVPLTATPSNGYSFSSWTGPVASASSASTTVTMSAPESVTANFMAETPQTITFNTIATQVNGGVLKLTATATSGLPVSYQSNTTGVCTVSNSSSTATMIATGTCSITASQAGDGSTIAPAPSLSQSFMVVPANTGLVGQTLGPIRNNYSGFVGMEFTVGPTPTTVYSLGRFIAPGNSQTHTVKLAQANGADVPGGAVSINTATGAAGTYEYAALASPVTLLANTSYFLVSMETAGGDSWYNYGVVTPNANATVLAPTYVDNFGHYIPVTTLPGQSYVPLNFVFGAPNTTLSASITSPAASATLSGTSSITVSTTGAVANLQIQVDGLNQGSPIPISVNQGPNYTISFNTTTILNGTHTLVVVASDAQSDTVASAGVSINISNAVGGSSGFVLAETPGAARNNYSGYVGMNIKVGSTPVVVTSLGRYVLSGNSGTHTVKLVNSNGTDVPGGSVSLSLAGATPGGFTYGSLPAGVTLQPGATYYLVSQETTGGDRWSDIGTVTTSVVGSVAGPVYTDGFGNYVTVGGYGGQSYVPVSFQYGSTVSVISATITSPQAGALVSGSAVPVVVSTTGPVTSMQLQVNGVNSGSAVAASPLTFNTTGLTNGQYTLTVVASGSGSGSTAPSPGVTVTVDNGGPNPASFITSESASTLRNNYTGGVGMEINVGSTALTVSSLGRFMAPGNSGTHTLMLVQSNGTPVSGGSANVNMAGGTEGQFVYASLAAPVTLAANTTYYLVSQETAGGDMWYNLERVTNTGVAQILGPTYTDGHGNYAVVSGYPGYSYVPLSFLYQ